MSQSVEHVNGGFRALASMVRNIRLVAAIIPCHSGPQSIMSFILTITFMNRKGRTVLRTRPAHEPAGGVGMSYRSPKLLRAAKDQPCMICGLIGTTVACHIRSVALGSGTGIKAPDCLTAWLCQSHHDFIDGRRSTGAREERDALWHLAFARTVVQWFEQGIVVVK